MKLSRMFYTTVHIRIRYLIFRFARTTLVPPTSVKSRLYHDTIIYGFTLFTEEVTYFKKRLERKSFKLTLQVFI